MFEFLILLLQFFGAVIALVAVILILGAIGIILIQTYMAHRDKNRIVIKPEPRQYATIYDQMVAERKYATNSEFFEGVLHDVH